MNRNGLLDPRALDEWFVREVLPLEGALMKFLRRNWRSDADLPDLRQEIYARLCESVMRESPANPRAFVFTTARNLLVDRMRHAKVVPLEVVIDLESWDGASDSITPERQLTAREELRRLETGLNLLPTRCREVITLRKIEGLSQREVAMRMGIREDTVERQVIHGMRALADYMLGGAGRIRRPPAVSRRGRGA